MGNGKAGKNFDFLLCCLFADWDCLYDFIRGKFLKLGFPSIWNLPKTGLHKHDGVPFLIEPCHKETRDLFLMKTGCFMFYWNESSSYHNSNK